MPPIPPPRRLLAAALPLVGLAAAQVQTKCNPLERSDCPGDPALGAGADEARAWDCAPPPELWEATAGRVAYDGPGASAAFTVSRQGDSPTLRSTFYVFFGRAEVWLRAARGRGIVSSVMWLSGALDELDWELLGANDTHATTNFFAKGRQDFGNGAAHPLARIHDDFHNSTAPASAPCAPPTPSPPTISPRPPCASASASGPAATPPCPTAPAPGPAATPTTPPGPTPCTSSASTSPTSPRAASTPTATSPAAGRASGSSQATRPPPCSSPAGPTPCRRRRRHPARGAACRAAPRSPSAPSPSPPCSSTSCASAADAHAHAHAGSGSTCDADSCHVPETTAVSPLAAAAAAGSPARPSHRGGGGSDALGFDFDVSPVSPVQPRARPSPPLSRSQSPGLPPPGPLPSPRSQVRPDLSVSPVSPLSPLGSPSPALHGAAPAADSAPAVWHGRQGPQGGPQ